MAALDQAGGDDDGKEAGIAQQGAGAEHGGRRRLWPVERLQPQAHQAPSAATDAMTQIKWLAAIISTSSPQASAPAAKAAEPHSRKGP